MEKRLEITPPENDGVFSPSSVQFISFFHGESKPKRLVLGWLLSNDGTIVPFSHTPWVLALGGQGAKWPRFRFITKSGCSREEAQIFLGWWQLKYFSCSPRKFGMMNPFWWIFLQKGLVQPPTSSSWFNNSVFFLEDGPRIQFLLNGVKKKATIDGLIK